MERSTFITSGGALGVSTLLSSFKAKTAHGASLADVLLPKQSREQWPPGERITGAMRPGAKPLGTESDDLTEYTGIFGDAQLRHLLRRTMFGVPESQFIAAKALGSMSAIVTKLLECQDTTKVPLPQNAPTWVSDYPDTTGKTNTEIINIALLEENKLAQLENWWFDLIVQEDLSIRNKMTLLWTNHFVTGDQTVGFAGYVYTYLMTCMSNALGNFKDFAAAISIDPAMLVYLNGNQNFIFGGQPFVNENYARELMELFTLGLFDPNSPPSKPKANYTEADIQNSARALTGWQPSTSAPFVGQFNPSLHDTGSKTFLGQTGKWALSDIINIIFEQGATPGYTAAYWVCQKIYQEFVYYVPNKSVVAAMANLMLNPPNPYKPFDIAPVMEALLSSEHFYDENVIGAQIKGPVEFMACLVREFALTYKAFDGSLPTVASTDPTTHYNTYTDTNPTLTVINELTSLQGQELLNPPNVKGWPGGENWLSSGAFLNREEYSYAIVNNYLVNPAFYPMCNLAFDPDKYAAQIPNAGLMTAEALSRSLEDTSMAFAFGSLEGTDLDTEIQGTYLNPNYQYNTLGVNNFATYLTNLPEFQLY